MEVRVSSTLPRRNWRKSCYGHNQRLPYTEKRSANGIRTKYQIISEQAFLFGSHPYISLQFYTERGIVHFLYLQELTNLIRNLILFDIAENMSNINLNEFVWRNLL